MATRRVLIGGLFDGKTDVDNFEIPPPMMIYSHVDRSGLASLYSYSGERTLPEGRNARVYNFSETCPSDMAKRKVQESLGRNSLN